VCFVFLSPKFLCGFLGAVFGNFSRQLGLVDIKVVVFVWLVGWLGNGGEDDEVAAMAASGVEEVRGEARREEAGGGRSGAGGRRKGGIRGGDQVEGPEAGAELAEEDGCEEKLHKGGGGGGGGRGRSRGPPKRRCRGVGRGVSDPLYSLRLQGQCVSPLGGRFHCLQCESLRVNRFFLLGFLLWVFVILITINIISWVFTFSKITGISWVWIFF
jgi:hypothetical protein